MNTIETTDVFDVWLAALRDPRAVSRVNARIFRAEHGNFGDCSPVGEGVSEMRIHYGPGYRVYFKQTGRTVYLLLAGGDKSAQTDDIQTAQALARRLRGKEN
ncbi:MAG: type II toxin-antitoxin system RelE/ParE family toxin [Zoogloeaceae bacterium]|jgi:putative addiction module killer protein|nr:type II toxin-antitoxin system RelE/ParE family toxin [Zoogloeaceae bacterium]